MSLIHLDELNAETPLKALVGRVTPNDQVYVRSHSAPPAINADKWALTVRGVTETSVSLRTLQNMATVATTVTMECAGNGRDTMVPQPGGTPWGLGAVSTASYTGIPLRTVLDSVGVEPGTVEVLFTGADSGETEPGRTETYRRSLPLTVATDPSVLLAWEMGGEPLTPEHGAPVRLVVPGWYGMASVKWLVAIESVPEPFSGYYQDDRYVYDGEAGLADGTPVTTVRVRSLIATPTEGEAVAGPLEIAGGAWSGDGSISSVEVSVDGGANWQLAALDAAPSPAGATMWRLLWTPPAGQHELVARATDSAGNVQPLQPVWNENGYGNNVVHRVTVTATS